MRIHKLICVATSFLVLCPPVARAGCGVQCGFQQTAFVATPYAVVTGIPVAQYAATTYSYTPQQAPQVTVNVQLDRATIAAAFKDALGPDAPIGPGPGPLNASPSPGPVANPQTSSVMKPPPPKQQADVFAGAVAENCVKCHGQGGKQAALAKINLENVSALTCEQRLAAARAVLSTKMPQGKKLDPEAAGHVLEELVGP